MAGNTWATRLADGGGQCTDLPERMTFSPAARYVHI